MRVIVLIVVAVAGLSVACAPRYGIAGRSYVRTAPAAAASDVTGRWDNVMMLPPKARVHVLLMDGVRAEGDIVSASATSLKLAVAAGEIEIATERVARVDRAAGSDRLRRGLSGAAHGAGAVGVLGLLTGRLPPARLFAAGAIAGADANIHTAMPADSQTIYVAPQVRR